MPCYTNYHMVAIYVQLHIQYVWDYTIGWLCSGPVVIVALTKLSQLHYHMPVAIIMCMYLHQLSHGVCTVCMGLHHWLVV